MILPDTNVWLALCLSKHVHHQTARDWLAQQSTAESIAFCRSTQQSFLRLLTTEAFMGAYGIAPLSNLAAWNVYREFRADERIRFLAEPTGLERAWESLAAGTKASPKVWMDAYLAAFALCSASRMVTLDKAFSRYKGLDLLVLGAEPGG